MLLLTDDDIYPHNVRCFESLTTVAAGYDLFTTWLINKNINK